MWVLLSMWVPCLTEVNSTDERLDDSFRWISLSSSLCPITISSFNKAGAFSNLPRLSRRPNYRAYYPEMPPSPDSKKGLCGQPTLHWLPSSTAAVKSWRKRPHSSPEPNWSCCRVRQEEQQQRIITQKLGSFISSCQSSSLSSLFWKSLIKAEKRPRPTCMCQVDRRWSYSSVSWSCRLLPVSDIVFHVWRIWLWKDVSKTQQLVQV